MWMMDRVSVLIILDFLKEKKHVKHTKSSMILLDTELVKKFLKCLKLNLERLESMTDERE